jgi:hypothetical protein
MQVQESTVCCREYKQFLTDVREHILHGKPKPVNQPALSSRYSAGNRSGSDIAALDETAATAPASNARTDGGATAGANANGASDSEAAPSREPKGACGTAVRLLPCSVAR